MIVVEPTTSSYIPCMNVVRNLAYVEVTGVISLKDREVDSDLFQNGLREIYKSVKKAVTDNGINKAVDFVGAVDYQVNPIVAGDKLIFIGRAMAVELDAAGYQPS